MRQPKKSLDSNEQFQSLASDLSTMAKHLMQDRGELWPFAALVAADEVVSYVTLDDKNKDMDMPAYFDALLLALRKMVLEKQYTAVGVCMDITFNAGDYQGEGLRFWMENHEGETVTLIEPYTADTLDERDYEKEILWVEDDSPQIFRISIAP